MSGDPELSLRLINLFLDLCLAQVKTRSETSTLRVEAGKELSLPRDAKPPKAGGQGKGAGAGEARPNGRREGQEAGS